jgi:hypothetical protein
MEAIQAINTTQSLSLRMNRMVRLRGMGLALLGFAVLTFFPADPLEAQAPRQIGPIGGGGGIVLPPYLPPPPPPETTPLPPYGTHVPQKTSTTVSLGWRDDSEVEDGYRIERQVGGAWVTIAQLPPIGAENIGYYTARGLAQATNLCFRVVPWNELGSPSVPAVCTATTRVISPITVVVSDMPGLVGELADLSPLVYWPDLLALDSPGTTQAAPTPPAFPVPPARKIVYVADGAQIHVGTGWTLGLQEGVHLMSGRGGLTQGALLYSDVATEGHRLLWVRGNNVRVSGLRFRGPSAGTDKDLPKTTAIRIENVFDVVIDHNEFYNWTSAGVSIAHAPRATYADPRPITFSTARRIRVTENFFHHNQKQNSGYGVVVEQSSYAYIDKNTFDYNRHAVASTGGRRGYPMNEAGEPLDPSRGPEHGYAAYLNLVLDGHASQTAVEGVITWQTHHFDVHGTEEDWLGVDYYDGWAGETIDVARNSFLSVKGTAFNVRGTPASGAFFHNNVTPALVPLNGTLVGLQGGVSYYGWVSVNEESDEDNVYVYGNVPASDPRGQFGVGDFDGDGRDDVLLATGQAFYYSSGGMTEWRYLNRSGLLIGALTLADYDGNGKTDVVTRVGSQWWVSWNGTASFTTFTPSIGASSAPYDREEVFGDFTGDNVPDRLRYDGDRYFRIVDGVSGVELRSRHRM